MRNNVEENAKILRKFHNYVKFLMYKKYCTKESTLLDLGVGRGGDMMKWNNVGISKVIGIDINKSFILDAIKRYKNMSDLKEKNYNFYFTTKKYIFKDFLRYKGLQQQYDNISCMFVLHYFCGTKENLCNIFEQVSSSLNKDGYFFGTVMNGVSVEKLIETSDIYTSDAIFVRKEYTQQNDFGNKISFMLSGTLYFGEKSLSTEYLVYESVLRNIGKLYNLELIEFNSFSKYHTDMFKMDECFSEASFLNYTFCFKKTDNCQ